jgi:hypothetical protein
MKRVLYILIYILFLTNYLLAQKLVTTTSSSKVAVGEAFQIQFSLTGSGSNFKLPSMPDFEIFEGPYQSSSTSITNGIVNQSSSLTYVLGAKREGKLTIGPASAVSGGKTIQSNPITIEVTKGKANAGTQGGQAVSKPTSKDINENVFVRASVNKSKVYIGEVIDVTFKVYTRMEMQMRNFTKLPTYDGFFVQDIKNREKSSQTNETINGITYVVGEIYKTFVIPQHTGKLIIDPFEIECIVRQKSTRKPRDIFEQIMGGGYEEVLYPLKSLPVSIDVQALPEEGKPAGFSGAVGSYTYKAALSKEKVKANEAVNLTLTLSGKGNIKLIEPLKVNFPEDFETYDPKTNEKISVTENGINGSKTFDYLVIPRHEGAYTIEQLQFSYFDPSKKEYVSIPTPEFNLQVEKGDETSALVSVGTSAKEELKVLGNDIRYIKTKTNLKDKGQCFFGSAFFFILLLSPFIIFVFFLILRRKQIEQNKDGIAVKSKRATKMAKKRLSIAAKYLKSNNKELFYIEIFKALYGYISDKLNIPAADLNKEHIAEKMKNRSVSSSTIQKLISTLDNCEYARYAPGSVSGDLNYIYNSTVELITKIEDEII